MKVLIVGDAVVSSGFARCTHALADELHKRGHEVAIIGINYWGDPHPYPYAVFPAVSFIDGGKDRFGEGRLPRLVNRYEPDIVVLVNDPWNLKGYFDAMDEVLDDDHPRPKMVGWLAIDSKNHKLDYMDKLDHIVVWTRFAEEVIKDTGCVTPITVVPLGINRGTLYPVDKIEARKRAMAPGDAEKDLFVVGLVGRNQHRKRVDLAIEVFAKARNLSNTPDDWRLYIHAGPSGDKSYDIPSLADYWGVRGSVIVSKVEGVGSGLDESLLPYLYSSFDVYMSTSQGEGWGLPAQEAMACGVPCLLPNWGSFGPGGWIPEGCALKIDVGTHLVTAPFGAAMYTVGGIPDTQKMVDKLAWMGSKAMGALPRPTLTAMREKAQELANRLTLDLTGTLTADVLESLM